MKLRLSLSIVTGCILLGLLTGCSGDKNVDTSEATDVEESTEQETQEQGDIQGNSNTSEQESEDSEYTFMEEFDREVILENPSYDYYCSDKVQKIENLPEIALHKISEEQNDITDVEKWFDDNGLEMVDTYYQDENYSYEWSQYGDSPYLYLTELSTGDDVYFDLSAYWYGDEYVDSDFDYIDQRVLYATAQDGILYFGTAHNTYADSCPQTAYITAVDLTDDTVLWKTEPLVCNVNHFEIYGDYIISGYGFTAEKDYLKIIRKDTGELVQEIPLKTGPDYIYQKDGILYVRTYDTNVTFSID